MNLFKSNLTGEAWWIDYMEEEADPSDRESLDMLLDHSVTDQLILQNYRSVRRTIKAADPALGYEKLLSDQGYQMKFCSQVMKNLDKRCQAPTSSIGALLKWCQAPIGSISALLKWG